MVTGPAANPANESALGNVTLGEALSTDDVTLTPQFTLIPNPAKAHVTLDTKLDVDGITFYDVLGQAVLQLDRVPASIDVSALRAGLYVVTVESRNKRYSSKLLIE